MLSNRDHRSHSDQKTAIDPRVEALLSAAAAPTEAGRLPGEEQALAAFRAAAGQSAPAAGRPGTTALKRALVGVVGAGVLLTGGVAAAVTGSLPDVAQGTADTWLEQVGVEVPGAGARGGVRPDERDATQEADAPAVGPETRGPAEPAAAEHGRQVSGLAQDTDETGADKGAAISEEASDGRSHAGDEHPGETTAPGAAGQGGKGTASETGSTNARVEVPNHGAAAGERKGAGHSD